MPNGFHGSREDWERITAPLREIDAMWDAFAERHGCAVTRDGRSWPERSLRWQSGGVERRIQVYLADERELTFSFGLQAWSDRDGKRYVRNERLYEGEPWLRLRDAIEARLEEAYQQAASWSFGDLENALDLPDR